MKKIFQIFSIIFFISITVKLLDVSKNLIIASKFGVSDYSDIYLALISLPESLVILLGIDTVRGVANSEFSSLNLSENENHLRLSFQNLFKVLFIIGVILTLPMVLFRDGIIKTLFMGFSDQKLQLASKISIFIIPIFLLKILIGYLITVNNSIKRFYLPVILSSLVPIIMIILVIPTSNDINLLYIIAIGAFAGNLLFLLFLVIGTGKLFKGITFRFPKIDGLTKKILLGSLTTLVLVIINQIYFFSRNFFVSFFPEGSLSSINYATSVTGLIGNLLFTTVFSVILTYLSNYYEEKKINEARNFFWKIVLYLSFLIIPLILVFLIGSEEILTILFKRGNFEISGINKVIQPFFWESFSIYSFILYIIPTALFLAFKKYKQLTIIGCSFYLFGILLNYILSKYIGYTGISLSGFIISFGYGLTLLIYSRKFWTGHWTKLKSLILIQVSGILTYAVAMIFIKLIATYWHYYSNSIIFTLIVKSISIFLIYYLITNILSVNYYKKIKHFNFS